MTQLIDLVEAFKREVAVPGDFAGTFPATQESDLVAALADAFAQAQLEGFFPTHQFDITTGVITPDLSVAGGALVVMYAGARMLKHRLLGMAVGKRYKAGPTEYETSPVASLLTQMLKELQGRITTLITGGADQKLRTTVFVVDSYPIRAGVVRSGFFRNELPGG